MRMAEPTHHLFHVRTSKMESSVFERLLAADKAVAEAVVEPAVVLAVDVTLRGEPLDLSGESGRELGSIEPVDEADPALSLQQALVVRIHVVTKNGHQPHPRDHHPLLRIRLPLRRRHGRGEDQGAGPGSAAATAARRSRRRQHCRAPPCPEPIHSGDLERAGRLEGLHGSRRGPPARSSPTVCAEKRERGDGGSEGSLPNLDWKKRRPGGPADK